MIVNGKVHPGAHLYLGEIAETLGVSTNPVREALRRLESEGLIVNRPHAGATVAVLSDEKIEIHFLIRGVLEGLAVRLAASHLTDQALEQIDAFDRNLIALEDSADFTTWNETNIAFRRFVFEFSCSPELVAMIDLQRDRSPRYRHFSGVLALRAREGRGERHALIEALRARDGAAAERVQHATAARTGEVLCMVVRQANGRAEAPAESQTAPEGGGFEQIVTGK